VELAVTLTPDVDNPDVGDLYLTPQGQEFLRTSLGAEVAQRLTVRLQFFRGEWFLDLRQGVPYYQVVLRKGVSDQVLRAVFSQVILGTAGVASLSSLTFSLNKLTRVMTMVFVARLTDGTVFSSADYGPFVVTP
jgi:hypothetical protein